MAASESQADHPAEPGSLVGRHSARRRLFLVIRSLDHADADNQRDGRDDGAGKYKIVLQGEQKVVDEHDGHDQDTAKALKLPPPLSVSPLQTY